MNLSVRFGIVLIGLGVVFLGLYIQKKSVQGFQSGSGTETILIGEIPPPVPQSNTPAVAAQPAQNVISKPLINVDDMDTLIAKDKQIRSKMNMIITNKTASDVIFLNYIASDLLINLELIFKEVFQYIQTITDVPSMYNSNTEKNKHTIRQMIYTLSDQVDMLYNIYFTIPSNIVATDSIIISESAPANAINNPYVIAEASKQITAILSTLPSPGSKLNTYLTNLMNSLAKVSNNSTPSEISMFSMNLAQYFDTLDVQMKNVSNTLDKINKVSVTNDVSDDTLKDATKTKSSFLSTSITSLQSIQTFIEKSPNTDPKLTNALSDVKSRITSMQAALMSMKPSPVMENFASIMNPYDQLSPSAKQAREFGLGRKVYIDEVFSGLKLF
jgi:hypothetical protein